MNTDSGGITRKSMALSLILSPMKRVQSSPNLATANDSHSTEFDSWRSRSVTDGLKNGDASSSSLAAKGFRSVRPNLQDKKSPTQDVSPLPQPPPRRESFNLLSIGTNPPEFNSITDLANDLSSRRLTFTKIDRAVLKESCTVSSTSSYSYSETSGNSVQQVNQSTAANNMSNLSASATTSTQKRKVSSLKLTPVTIPDPPDHVTPQFETHSKILTSGSLLPSSPPPQMVSNTPQTPSQTASVYVHLNAENLKNPAALASNPRMEVKVPDQDPDQTSTPAPTQVKMTMPPPTIPPRPSPAQLLLFLCFERRCCSLNLPSAYRELFCHTTLSLLTRWLISDVTKHPPPFLLSPPICSYSNTRGLLPLTLQHGTTPVAARAPNHSTTHPA